MYSQLVIPVDLAQGGAFYGDDVAAAVGIGDFHLDPLGRSDLPGQISLVHPVGIHQRGGQGATLHQASGGIPVAQQIQHLISGAIILHHRRGDVIPLHGRLLAVVGKIFLCNLKCIHTHNHIRIKVLRDSNLYIAGKGVCRKFYRCSRIHVTCNLCNLRIGFTISRDFYGEGIQNIPTVLRVHAVQDNGIQNSLIAKIYNQFITLASSQISAADLSGCICESIWDFIVGKVVLYDSHQLACGGVGC